MYIRQIGEDLGASSVFGGSKAMSSIMNATKKCCLRKLNRCHVIPYKPQG